MLNKEKDVEFLSNYDDAFKNFSKGDIVKGKVIDVREKDVFVDIGYKSEGVIKIEEFADEDGNVEVAVGDEVEALFFNRTDSDGFEILSKLAADRIKGWSKIFQAYKDNQPVKGVIKSLVNGGFTVDLNGFLAFLPGSQVEMHPVKNYSSFVGKEFEFKIVNANESKRNAVLSRKVLLEEAKKKREEEIWKKIQEDAILEGKVKNITDYGVFVDLGGVDGLVHITDMSWSRIDHPSDMVSVGDEIKVKVIKIDDEGKHKKIYLGMKQLTDDPWEDVGDKFKDGDVVKGTIVNVVEYGLFVEISKGVEGLVHKSEITYDKYISHAKKLYKIGDEINAKIINIDPENRRMSLSIKQCKPEPWSDIDEKYKKGDIIEGVVTGVKDFGVFVKLEEGIEGLVHEKDLSWDKEDRPSLKVNDAVQVVVLNIDRDREKISLGIKQLTEDPWEQVESKYHQGDVVTSKVVSVKPFGAFVKIDKGIESLVPKSEFNNREPNAKEEIDVVILKIDKDKKRLISSFVQE